MWGFGAKCWHIWSETGSLALYWVKCDAIAWLSELNAIWFFTYGYLRFSSDIRAISKSRRMGNIRCIILGFNNLSFLRHFFYLFTVLMTVELFVYPPSHSIRLFFYANEVFFFICPVGLSAPCPWHFPANDQSAGISKMSHWELLLFFEYFPLFRQPLATEHHNVIECRHSDKVKWQGRKKSACKLANVVDTCFFFSLGRALLAAFAI